MQDNLPLTDPPLAVDDFPDQDPYQHHLSALLFEATQGSWRLPISECSTGRAILRCRRDLQVKILLAALVRRLWQLTPGCPESVARLFLLNELCRKIMRKKLPFENEQLEATLILVSEPTAATELGKSVVHQLEWHGDLTESVRSGLARLRKVLQNVKEHSLGRRTQSLLSRPDPALATAEESPERKRHWRAFLTHARRVPKKLSKRWRTKARALMLQVREEPFAQRLLPWVSQRLERMDREESRLLEGIVCACGELERPAVAEFLDRVATWGYKHVQGKGPRALRLANLALDSLGRMATTESIQYLVAIESEFPYSSSRERANRALLVAQARLSTRLDFIRETGIGDPDPLSRIGKRLTRAHSKLLEIHLRSGESLSGSTWNRRYLSCRVLEQLVRSLLWQADDITQFGTESMPKESKVRLWHPGESNWKEVVHWKAALKLQNIVQPFVQVKRRTFRELPVEKSPVLRQYQFAAIARERWWDLQLVGRARGSTLATLQLNEDQAEFEVVRADPNGPFHKNHTSYRVFLLPPRLKESRPTARHISEVARDWNLFCRAARDDRSSSLPRTAR